MAFQVNQERTSSISEEVTLSTALIMPRSIRRSGGATLIPITSLRSGVFSVRVGLTDDGNSVLELAKSVSASGIIAPIVVREVRVGEFEVIAGERRLLAAKLLKMAEVPCVVRECTEAEALTLSLTENLQRNNLSPIEKARGLRRLVAEMALTQQEVSERIGMPQSAIAHYLRLLGLPVEVQHLIHDGVLSMGHGKVLAGLKDRKRAVDLAMECVAKNRSVRDLEMCLSAAADPIAHRYTADSPRKTREERELPNGVFLIIKENLGEVCSGTIEIPYYSEAEKAWVLSALSERRARQHRRLEADHKGKFGLTGSVDSDYVPE